MSNLVTSELINVGLTKKEAIVYICSLRGFATITELAKRSNLKRPTAYVVIEGLVEKGLLLSSIQGKKKYYYGTDPNQLKRIAQSHLSAVEKVIPALKTEMSFQAGRPKINVYDGREGVDRLYKELYKSKEVRFWSNIGSVGKLFPEVLDKFVQKIQSGKIIAREIVEDSRKGRSYAREINRKKLPSHQIKVARSIMTYGDMFIFDDVLGMVSLKEDNLFVIRIQNNDFSSNMRSLYDLAWQSASKGVK